MKLYEEEPGMNNTTHYSRTVYDMYPSFASIVLQTSEYFTVFRRHVSSETPEFLRCNSGDHHRNRRSRHSDPLISGALLISLLTLITAPVPIFAKIIFR